MRLCFLSLVVAFEDEKNEGRDTGMHHANTDRAIQAILLCPEQVNSGFERWGFWGSLAVHIFLKYIHSSNIQSPVFCCRSLPHCIVDCGAYIYPLHLL